MTERPTGAEPASGPGLYVHVPFCRVRCPYCDFATAPYAARTAARYVRALLAEAERAPSEVRDARFQTLFYGGGTPSRLEPADFRALAQGLAQRLDLSHAVEITLEANPEDVSEERMDAWQEAGVTRLSIGVQSMEESELARLGRTHGAEGAAQAMRRCAQRFPDWSCDLMFGFPGHEQASWERTLGRALAHQPPHVSAYHFTPEKRTPMGTAVLSGRVRVPDEDTAGELFETASQRLRAAGYRHYEVSNYARPGHESKHNRLYLTGALYWGLGAGAVGTWDGVRRENTRDTAGYLARIEGGLSAVEAEYSVAGDSDLERVMMGLRLEEGLPWGGLDTDWQEAARAGVQQGWLAGDESGFRLTPERRALADEAARKLWSAVEAARGAGRSKAR